MFGTKIRATNQINSSRLSPLTGASSLPKPLPYFSNMEAGPTMPYPDYIITIHTDGSCSGNPGPGGYAAIIRNPRKQLEISGGEPGTTNNRMELRAVIEALNTLKRPLRLKNFSDSQYVIKGASEWLKSWKARHWKDVKNVDLWQALDAAACRHDIEWQWVRGHAGNEMNEKADLLANQGRERQKQTKRKTRL
ncbi:ribonuclease HI [uncultured Cohaesibacter sp.]|uniref:ribonuclease HI n=1 Tax=uncultured Cohaesibacter sp. TaxID=1002546 RepID=UPI002AAAA67A|nr:ribonuclease HI [uncultured Cohaesibacter sp.]